MNKKPVIGALLVGFINGLLGSGGGMIAVPALEKEGLSANKAHANSVAVILPLSILSAALYLWRGDVSIMDALVYLPGGIIGSFIGAWLMPRIPSNLLKKLFGGFAIWAGMRLLL